MNEVRLDKGLKPSFGICIVSGEVKDSPNSKVKGIFIKDIVPQSPAHLCGKLKVGDRILSLNDNDVRNANEQYVVDLIRQAGKVITLKVQTQTYEKKEMTRIGSKKKAPEIVNHVTNNYTSESTVVNSGGTSVANPVAEEDDDEEDDSREAGRMYTKGGVEIDRASAGNVKRSKAEIQADPEQEDEFGYTTNKIKKKYGSLGPVYKVEMNRVPNMEMGLALSGHRDRNKMAVFIAGLNPSGVAANSNLKAGDQVLEINGNSMLDRCHLNASVVLKGLPGEKLVFVVLRHPKALDLMASKPVTKFAEIVDETEYLLTAYKNARKVQVQKVGVSIGIMIIEGKHVEVGSGIFISDLQEDSNAEAAGLKVGELILAINKDVIVDANYDTAAGLLKRSEGIINLIVCNLKSEDQIAAEKAAEEEKNKPPPEPEKPQDPATAEIKTNRKTLIEINVEKKPIGCIVVGGKNGFVTSGVVITHLFPDGAFAKDNRLQVFDQIIDKNGEPMKANEMTVLKVHQAFNLPYDKMTLNVWRNDPPEIERIKLEVNKKAGKDLGLALTANSKGAVIKEIIPAGCPEIESKLQRGDIIAKLNDHDLEGATYEEIYAFFRQVTGKIILEIVRPKPTSRT